MSYKEINTIKKLADLLRCKPDVLNSIIDNGYFVYEQENDFDIYSKIEAGICVVEKFQIQKKNKTLGYRTIHKPYMDVLSNMFKILNNLLFSIYLPPENVHGFVKGRNTFSNAQAHLMKQNILSLDIKNFFESIDSKQIQESLTKLGFKSKVSEWISRIVTVNGRLVQGFNTSPVIANIVASDLDVDLIKKCKKSIVYTRYADDMYFSSDLELPASSDFEAIVKKHGFEINHQKTQLMKRGQNQYVTGLTVFDNLYPRISKKIKRNLRLEIHYINKYGYTNHICKKLGYSKKQLAIPEIKQEVYQETNQTENRIWGWIHFIQSIEPDFGKKLEIEFKKPKRKIYSDYILSFKFKDRRGNDEIIIQNG